MTASGQNGAGPQHRSKASRVFEEVNSRIREAAGRAGGDDPWDFICECDDLDCVRTVALTVHAYDAHRAVPASRILVDHV